jgi:nitrous oxidase accessory protein NosD
MKIHSRLLSSSAGRAFGFSFAVLLVACGDQHGAIAAPEASSAATATDPGHAGRVTVNTMDELDAAFKSIHDGDTILLSPGNYPVMRLRGKKFTKGVTIASANPAHPAVVAGIYLQESSGMNFRGLDVTVDPRIGIAVNLSEDSNVRVEGLDIYDASHRGMGVMVRDCTNVSVEKSNIHDITVGIQHLDNHHLLIANNNIHDAHGDGIKGGGSSFVTITGNHFTNFSMEPGDHPDAIQFWTVNIKEPTHDLVITDNVYVRGDGVHVQGIFLGNETNTPYENVTITGNAIIGGMYHGISVYVADNVQITNNLVQGYSDMTSWIMLNHTTNSTVSDNKSTSINYDKLGNVKLTARNNRGLSLAKIGDASVLKDWPAAQSK